MAKTLSAGSVTQLTAAGNTNEIDLTTFDAAVISVRHANGTGTITAGATVQPQITHDGTNWRNDGVAFAFGTTASVTEQRTYVPPTDGFAVRAVRFAYTVPTGSTGHTLNADYSRVAR